jgi:hypothetical protein
MIKKIIMLVSIGIIGISAIVKGQPLPSYVPGTGLLGWWSFTGNGNDISGNANNAVNYGATFSTDRHGNAGSAVNVDGISTYLQVPTPNFAFSETGTFTYSVWVNKQVQTTSAVVLMIGSTVANNFISNVQGQNEIQFGTNKQQSAWIWTTCPHTLYQWDHIVATYNGGIMNLYKNGVYQSSATYTYTGALTTVMPIYFGRGVSGNNYIGDLDDVGIWNRQLALSEIQALYEGCDLSVTNGPVSTAVLTGLSAQFTTTASYANASYQWQSFQGGSFQNLINAGQFNGVNTTTLTISNTTLSNSGLLLRCYVSSGTCADTSNVATLTVANNVGIQYANKRDQISVFPNPATDVLNVQLVSVIDGSEFLLSDPLGKAILKGKLSSGTNKIDISGISAGSYILHIGEMFCQVVFLNGNK